MIFPTTSPHYKYEDPEAEVSTSWQAGAQPKHARHGDGLPRPRSLCRCGSAAGGGGRRNECSSPHGPPHHMRRSSQSGSAPFLKHLPNHLTHRAPCRPLWFQDLGGGGQLADDLQGQRG